jgi:CheY-like chemotaxis protein
MDLFSKLKKMRILLIDDDEWIRDSLSLYFEGEGCHLFALETAEEGIEALKGQNYREWMAWNFLNGFKRRNLMP